MPKAVWKGNIAFGLVVLPVKLYSAAEPKLLSFHLLCKKHNYRLKNRRYCEKGRHDVAWSGVVHGIEYRKGKWIVLTKEELQQLPIPQSKNIEIVEFVDASEVDPLFFDKSYFVVPEKGAEKAFALLKDVLQTENKAAVGKVVIRNRDYLVLLRGYQNAMVLTTLFYSDEIRRPEMFAELALLPKPSKAEAKAASQLVSKLTKHFDLEGFKSNYKEVVSSLIEAKLKGKRVVRAKPTKNIMSALKASLAKVKKAK